MRLFLAIEIPPRISEEIVSLRAKFIKRTQIREVKKDNLHLTIKFLGEVDEGMMNKVIQAIKNKVRAPSFKLKVKGAGVFPSINAPRVIWVGGESEGNHIFELKKSVDETLSEIGFPNDKEFISHITIARVKGRTDIDEIKRLIREAEDKTFGEFDVEEFFLFESKLTPDGPIYKKIEAFRLLSAE